VACIYSITFIYLRSLLVQTVTVMSEVLFQTLSAILTLTSARARCARCSNPQ